MAVGPPNITMTKVQSQQPTTSAMDIVDDTTTNTWQQASNRKTKRQENATPRKIRKITEEQRTFVTETQNRFQPLTNNTNNADEIENQGTTPKVSKPPPIFVPEISAIQPLITILDSTAKENYYLKTVGNNQVKIQIHDVEKYRKTITALKENKVMFHTYQLKEERNYRVVIKNLHHSTDIKDLSKELEEKGHIVTNIYNIKHRIHKHPLPIFFIELKPNANNKTIYDIKHLQYTRVIIEPPKPKREIPQCSRCQLLGHTKAYCTRRPRCVKCGEGHQTMDCSKDIGAPVKCALCNGDHPANYKGCTIYKEIQQRRFPSPRERKIPQPVTPDITYAQITGKNTTEDPQINTIPTTPYHKDDKLEQMMIQLMGRMDTILNLLTTLVSKMT